MSRFLSIIPVLLFGVGFFYILRLRGFYLFHPIRCCQKLASHRPANGISPFRALTVALAGTLGVGNIVGVASALYLGGAGAVFWMTVSALVAMVLKYAEITLAMRHRRMGKDGTPTGGAPYYIEDTLRARHLPRLGRTLAMTFAVLCLLNAITMGGVLQINAVAGAMEEGFSVPPLASGLILAALCIPVARGGAARLSAWTEKLIPFMTLAFLLASVAVLVLRRERLDEAIRAIWQEALDPLRMGAGVGGFLLSRGLRYGVMRGLVSNEAGCGTAPMAHVAADTDSPATQGIFGLVEVFVDTVVLCTVTALVILVSDSGPNAYGEDAVRTAAAAFSSVLGDWAGGFFALSIFLFGAATILCWAHYGMTATTYLTDRRGAAMAFLVAFAVSLVGGSVAAPRLAWTLADVAIALMTILNLAILLLSHREVKEETDILFSKHKTNRKHIIYEGKCKRKEPHP